MPHPHTQLKKKKVQVERLSHLNYCRRPRLVRELRRKEYRGSSYGNKTVYGVGPLCVESLSPWGTGGPSRSGHGPSDLEVTERKNWYTTDFRSTHVQRSPGHDLLRTGHRTTTIGRYNRSTSLEPVEPKSSDCTPPSRPEGGLRDRLLGRQRKRPKISEGYKGLGVRVQ